MNFKTIFKSQRTMGGFALVLGVSLLLMGCGGGGGGSSTAQSTSTGQLVFKAVWNRTALSSDNTEAAGDIQARDLSDCLDVESVSAVVYDANGNVLQTGGPWSCSDHQGILTDVPANRTVYVVILGQSSNGLTLYRGQSTYPVFLPAGATVDAGTIVATSFSPTLISPEDGARVAFNNLVLAWSDVFGARTYRCTLASQPDFDAAAIVQTIVSDTPTCQPDTSGLNPDTDYFWRVQAIDAAGFISEPSAYRRFQVSYQVLVVTIAMPPGGTQVRVGTPLSFSATVATADGTVLNADDLTLVGWSSDRDGDLSSQLAFSAASLSLGTHLITLTVQDTSGMSGSATVTIEVLSNLPPVATITAPTAGATYAIGMGQTLSCQGSASDPEEGALTTSDHLQWQIVNLASPDHIIWQGYGPTVSVDYLPFAYQSGTYRVTLTATDAEGGIGSSYVDITVQADPNTPPTATIVAPQNGSTHKIGAGLSLACQGTGLDPEEGSLTSETLVRWHLVNLANPDHILWQGGGPSVSIDYLGFNYTSGTYRVTLTVTDSAGASDSADVDVTIEAELNAPPVTTIESPAHGTSFIIGSQPYLTCRGSAIDPEDGDLTSATQLSWSVVNQATQLVVWQGNGTSISIDAAIFGTSGGSFSITLTATDSAGVSSSAQITIVAETASSNSPPTASISSPFDGGYYYSFSAITCSGSGSDPEDGALSGTHLFWQAIDSIGTTGWSGFGASVTIPAYTFSDATGDYSIVLTVTDSQGASDTTSVGIFVSP